MAGFKKKKTNKLDQTVLVFDTETTGLKAGYHEVIEIAAVAYSYRTLEPIPGGEFYSRMRALHPERADKKALMVNGKTIEEIGDESLPIPKVVWPRFLEFCKKYNPGKGGPWTAPHPGGKNIKGFDLKFVHELNKLYLPKGVNTTLFHKVKVWDLEDEIARWFDWNDELEDYKMDTIREYFGLSSEGAHGALVDARQTGDLIMKFLQLYRTLGKKTKSDGSPFINFRDSMADRN